MKDINNLVFFGDGLRDVVVDVHLRRMNKTAADGRQAGMTNHADRVDSVPLVCDGVTLAKKYVAEVRPAVATQGLEGRALCAAEDVAFIA